MYSVFTTTAVGKAIGRRLLRAWARCGRAHGYFYVAMESWGTELSPGRTLPSLLPNGFEVDCEISDHVQRHIFFQGVYEPIEAFLFSRLAEPGMTVVDAGANIGQYSLLASSRVGNTGSVHAFEPVPKNHSRAAAHLRNNRVGNVLLNAQALWHEETVLELGRSAEMAHNDGSFSVGAASESAAPLVSAEALRFDHYASNHSLARVDLVKMDIEGAEWSALRGMRETLHRHRPLLLMEVNRSACERAGYDPSVFWNLLVKELGYKAWAIGTSAAAWAPLRNADGLTQANCLFTPQELPAAIRADWDFRGCIRWGASAGRRLV